MDPNENAGVKGATVTAFVCCVVGTNNGFLNCIKFSCGVDCKVISATFGSLVL